MKRPSPNSGQSNFPYTRYPEKCFTKYIEFCMKTPCLVPIQKSMLERLLLSLERKCELSLEKLINMNKSNTFPNT